MVPPPALLLPLQVSSSGARYVEGRVTTSLRHVQGYYGSSMIPLLLLPVLRCRAS